MINKKINYILIFITFLIKICDIILTYIALGLGGIETNPLLKDHMDNHLIVVLAVLSCPLLALLFNTVLKDELYLKAIRIGLIIVIIGGVFVIGNNIAVVMYLI